MSSMQRMKKGCLRGRFQSLWPLSTFALAVAEPKKLVLLL
jgi:hypothetical protein